MSSQIRILFKKVITDFFYISFISMVVFYFIEYFAPGFVVNYFNLNYLFVLCLLSGIIMVVLEED